VKIVRLGWAKKTLVQKRAFAALHIGIATPEQANILIKHGLRFENRLHRCEPFFRECQVNQCVRCHEYTHIAKYCPNRERCGFCASTGHKSQECMKKDTREAHQCSLCKNPNANHSAWAKQCPIRVQKQKEARQAYSRRPTQFQEKKGVQGPAQAAGTNDKGIQPIIPCTPFSFTSSSQVQLDQEDEDFIEGPAPKRKRRGRPTTREALHKASQSIQDIRVTFPNISQALAFAGPGEWETSSIEQPQPTSETTL
jgi:hypothetical protein